MGLDAGCFEPTQSHLPALDSAGQTDRLMDSLNSAQEPGLEGIGQSISN